jgi:integrating conjugative element protein (TIGR03765 family)
MPINAMALVDISQGDEGSSISAEPYLKAFSRPSQGTIDEELNHEKEQLENESHQNLSFTFPIDSDFSVGKVINHKISDMYLANECLFLIGDDGVSLRWFHQNSVYLKKIHAIGIATNIDSQEALSDLQKETGYALMPASMTGMQESFGTNHYPFLLYKGWILQ